MEFITCPSHRFFQKIGELNEANIALKERIELFKMEKVRPPMNYPCSHKWFWKKKREGLLVSASFLCNPLESAGQFYGAIHCFGDLAQRGSSLSLVYLGSSPCLRTMAFDFSMPHNANLKLDQSFSN